MKDFSFHADLKKIKYMDLYSVPLLCDSSIRSNFGAGEALTVNGDKCRRMITEFWSPGFIIIDPQLHLISSIT